MMIPRVALTFAFILTVGRVCSGAIIWDSGHHLIEPGDEYNDSLLTQQVGTTVDMSGGEITGSLGVYSGSSFIMSGGILHGVTTYGASTLDVSGGQMDTLQLYDSSTVTFSGGEVTTGYIYAVHSSTVHIYGYGFDYTPGGPFDGGTLTGSWVDDTSFTMYLHDWDVLPDQHTYDHVVLHDTGNTVPEPSSIITLAGLLATFGAFGWWKKRKQVA